MLDSQDLSEYPFGLLDSIKEKELQQRLALFQFFSKLYEHHRSFLNAILELENLEPQSGQHLGLFQYIQGIVSESGAFLVANLLDGKSRALIQESQIWTIGRDPRQAALTIGDKRLSRCHAAIQYRKRQGFCLFDLDSANGSFVNGARVRQQQRLKDGDHIRLGSLTFVFFICKEFRAVANPSSAAIAQIENSDTSAMENVEHLDGGV
ncbi:MAG: FHA domain-containing protein [Leptolyngbyaceae cyanobacterium MO_188.B28]|nr:FHA domain-containing protein [Leptolyngbyaceae cyanobacterium MO_188.B28]